MREYDIVTDPVKFFAGTDNRTSPVYIEAAKTVETKTPKSMGYIKNFVSSIERLTNGMKDDKVSKSKGNITTFTGYKNINAGLDFLSTHLRGDSIVTDLKNILRALESNQNHYIDGYSKQVRIIVLEYEASVYMLVTGISFALASYTDIKIEGKKVTIIRKAGRDKGIITKTIHELGRELNTKNHQNYLIDLIKGKSITGVSTKVESVSYTEAAVGDTMELIGSLYNGGKQAIQLASSMFRTLYRTMFGILPLIRSALYLRFKRKADTILALENQIQFIEMNIDQLKNIKTIDEAKKAEIIKKQQAVIEQYRKKSEKLRAQLIETEKEAAVAINQEDHDIKKDSSDDFILD